MQISNSKKNLYETELCTLIHLFAECQQVRIIWFGFLDIPKSKCKIIISYMIDIIVLGTFYNFQKSDINNICLLLLKQYIYIYI